VKEEETIRRNERRKGSKRKTELKIKKEEKKISPRTRNEEQQT